MRPKTIRSFVPAIFFAIFILFIASLPAKALPTALTTNFVLIRGGEFTMGSPVGEVGRGEAETQHQVRLSSFYMSKYAVTVAEFRRFVEASGYQTDAEKEGWSIIASNGKLKNGEGVNWRHGVSGSVRPQSEENHPVLHVSWNDAVGYCKWLSAKTGKHFRLPKETEREYACRAGTSSAFNTGENITIQQANFLKEEGQWGSGTVPVDSFSPNAWGLYNMHGNVYEWSSDWYSDTYYVACKAKGTVTNPTGPATGLYRVLRGGCWNLTARYCRSAERFFSPPGYRYGIIGFRLVCVP